VFSQPELATVGLTEAQAKQQYTDIAVYRSDFKPMFDTLGQGSDRTFMKMIVNKTNDRVIGCHMVGHHAAEIIQGVAIAIKAGATKSHLIQPWHPSVDCGGISNAKITLYYNRLCGIFNIYIKILTVLAPVMLAINTLNLLLILYQKQYPH
jgi:hypothetical protein